MENLQKAEETYQRIQPKLKGQQGKIVAIELDSGDYYIGETPIEAYELGTKKHPGKLFLFKRVGFPTMYRIGAGLP